MEINFFDSLGFFNMHYDLSRLLSNHKDLHEWDKDTEGEMIQLKSPAYTAVLNDSVLQLSRGIIIILLSRVSPVNDLNKHGTDLSS